MFADYIEEAIGFLEWKSFDILPSKVGIRFLQHEIDDFQASFICILSFVDFKSLYD